MPHDAFVPHALRLQTPLLSRAESANAYALYRAALEWALPDPIVFYSRDDLKSRPRWQECIEPYHHQVSNLITFCRRLPVTLLADDVGLGKTISAGLIASELIARRRVRNILVVAPKLLGPQWKEELETKFGIPAVVAAGRQLVDVEPGEIGAVITTYHSARTYIDRLPADRFQMLVLDEAHKLRNLYGTQNTPQVAKRFRHVLASRLFKYVLMLTATPIQNRLWDIYSLVDLLAVARGHQNPFGSEGRFASECIADKPVEARRLRPEARERFRSVVYSYMSRIRRQDADLQFPERVLLSRAVQPTPLEQSLYNLVKSAVRGLEPLSQISILQALTSSPEALLAQLETMARNQTAPAELAASVRGIVRGMPSTAKLEGLGLLVDDLRRERPRDWRMIVFTQRRETQTRIATFLEAKGLSVGLINGQTAQKNQATLKRFRTSPPDLHVIVSTEAGSEGVNLQAANVVVNYDLPWNPMIVEQRIGRVQRLASEHAKVFVYSVVLKGTFEQYIVARLLEKLHMASEAIGDVEALLEASGIAGDGEDGIERFEENIRRLVLASLDGKDVEAEIRKKEESIAKAKATLASQQQAIDETLGPMPLPEGPRNPRLPAAPHSMAIEAFVVAALVAEGAELRAYGQGLYARKLDGRRELIQVSDALAEPTHDAVLYAPGTAAFERLVARMTRIRRHAVRDLDQDKVHRLQALASAWVESFGGSHATTRIEDVRRCFNGDALVHIRATVAHDSYERLVTVAARHDVESRGDRYLQSVPENVKDLASLGLDLDRVGQDARRDPAIAEFCRLYRERLDEELKGAGGDERRRRKLEDDFTPRLDMTLVGLEGSLHRELKCRVEFGIDGGSDYAVDLTISPHDGQITAAPAMRPCAVTGRMVPEDCLESCAVSGSRALRHLLESSEMSGRRALPEHTAMCSLSGKRVLSDEVERSSVTDALVARDLLKTSPISGQKAEPQHFARCAFTGSEVLQRELTTSQISGRPFRADQAARSAVSGLVGHRSELLTCVLTGQALLPGEAERCEVTGKPVMPGLLETCEVSRRRVLPSELERCAITGQRVVKRDLATSGLSGLRFLEALAVSSSTGAVCTPSEAKTCVWAGAKVHPEDVRTCALTGLPIHARDAIEHPARLRPLAELLEGMRRPSEGADHWSSIGDQVTKALGGRCHVESAVLSPDGRCLAVCAERRTLLGLKVRHVGCVYTLEDHAILGRIAVGKRTDRGWMPHE